MTPVQRSTAGPWLHGALWRFLAAAAVLGGALWLAGPAFAELLLPAFRAVVQGVDDNHRVEALVIDREGADQVFRLTVSRQRYVVVGGQALAPHPLGRANASTLVGHAQLSLVLLFAAALALPAAGAAAVVARLAAAAMAALVCLLLDTPLVLSAQIHGLYLSAFEPDAWSPGLAWSACLDGGGRHAMALGSGLLIGACSSRRSAGG